MKDELITFETARLAKEKGFDWRNIEILEVKSKSAFLDSTTQGLLQRWLREVHKIHISPMFIGPDTNKYQYRIDTEGSGNTGEYSKWFTNFEECFEDGLMFGLKLIKNEQNRYPSN